MLSHNTTDPRDDQDGVMNDGAHHTRLVGRPSRASGRNPGPGIQVSTKVYPQLTVTYHLTGRMLVNAKERAELLFEGKQ